MFNIKIFSKGVALDSLWLRRINLGEIFKLNRSRIQIHCHFLKETLRKRSLKRISLVVVYSPNDNDSRNKSGTSWSRTAAYNIQAEWTVFVCVPPFYRRFSPQCPHTVRGATVSAYKNSEHIRREIIEHSIRIQLSIFPFGHALFFIYTFHRRQNNLFNACYERLLVSLICSLIHDCVFVKLFYNFIYVSLFWNICHAFYKLYF